MAARVDRSRSPPGPPPGTGRPRTARTGRRRRSGGAGRAPARPVRAWPCRRPSPGRRASSRPRRSRRPGTRASASERSVLPDGRRTDERERRSSGHAGRPQTATASGDGTSAPVRWCADAADDPGVRERTRAPARRGCARCGWSACVPGSTVLASPHPPPAPRTCRRPGRATRSSEIRCCSSTSRSNRSCTTSLGTWSSYAAACVPGPRRVLERVRAVEPRPLDHVQRLGEVLLGLAGEPDDDVGRDRDVGDRGADRVEPTEVSLAPVRAPHRLEHAVGARLQREVDVLADGRRLGHRVDHVGGEVVRMRRREPHPSDAVDPRRPAGAARANSGRFGDPGTVTSRPYVFTFWPRSVTSTTPRRGEALHLRQDVADRARPLRPPDERHDAERAGVVAPRRDRHPRAERRRDAPPAARSGTPPCTRGRPSAARRPPRPSAARGGAGGHACRPRRRPTARGAGSRPVLLREAARHHDAERRVIVLQRLQVAEVAVQPVVGVLADGARVEHDDARRRPRRPSGVMPSAASSPPIRSESCSFIWHPKVRIRYVRSIASRLPTWRTPRLGSPGRR